MQQPEPPIRGRHRESDIDGPNYLAMPYRAWPASARPTVHCGGCNEEMQPVLDPRYPHEFRCPGECAGYVDIIPPRTPRRTPTDTSWGNHQCGVLVRGKRCVEPVASRDDFACRTCTDRIIRRGWETKKARGTILELVGNLMMQRERAKRLREERNAQTAAAEARAQARLNTSHHVVYYVRLGRNHIKIGTTGDLPRRMNELRCVNPANLLAAEPGAHTLEKERHTQFKKWRYSVRREDFAEAPELLEHIATVRAEHGDPYTVAAQLVQRQTIQ